MCAELNMLRHVHVKWSHRTPRALSTCDSMQSALCCKLIVWHTQSSQVRAWTWKLNLLHPACGLEFTIFLEHYIPLPGPADTCIAKIIMCTEQARSIRTCTCDVIEHHVRCAHVIQCTCSILHSVFQIYCVPHTAQLSSQIGQVRAWTWKLNLLQTVAWNSRCFVVFLEHCIPLPGPAETILPK